MSRLTPALIENSPQFLNPLKDREIDLRNNKISIIENLGITKDSFDTIDLSDNSIFRFENFPLLKRLQNLYMNNNSIKYFSPDLPKNLPNLESLNLANNNIETFDQIMILKHFRNLEYLSLEDNIVSSLKNYRYFVINLVPSLKFLDFIKITKKERDLSKSLFTSKDKGKGPIMTFVPGEIGDEIIGVSKNIVKKKKSLSEREKELIRAAIDNAKSISEVNRLESCLIQGVLPKELQKQI